MPRIDAASAVLESTRFVTFDGSTSATTWLQRPDRYRHIEMDFGAAKRIARGAGMSYAAASFGPDSIVQQMSSFDRLLGFDADQRTLRVEAGASIGSLAHWAGVRGLLMPVLPGYPTITVGGCIAADVHGKNPLRDGTFGEWVLALTLYHPRHGFRSIDRTRDPAIFDATCGGFGLTGLIVDATLRMVEQRGSTYAIDATAVSSLSQAREAVAGFSESHEFAYSWHDGTLRGAAFGQGIVFSGTWSDEPDPGCAHGYRALTARQRGRLPLCLWSRTTARLGNAYFRRAALNGPRKYKGMFDGSFPFARQTLYHQFFGRRGLAEAQILVPDSSWSTFLDELVGLVGRVDPPLMMMSLKGFRSSGRALGLSGQGTLVALDLVREPLTLRFLEELDALVIAVGAQPNAVKDSRMPRSLAAASLPHYASFRRQLHMWDPKRLYESELSRRLEL